MSEGTTHSCSCHVRDEPCDVCVSLECGHHDQAEPTLEERIRQIVREECYKIMQEQNRTAIDRELAFDWKVHMKAWEELSPDLPLAERFEYLRRQGPKQSRAQAREMEHFEMHLDRGDVVCRCFDHSNEFED